MKTRIAYLAGLVAADGSLSKDTGLAIYIKDKVFTKRIRHFLSTVTRSKISIYKSKGAFRVNVFDQSLFGTFNRKFRIPFGKKSDRLLFPKHLSKREKLDFVKGYVDGDGSIYMDKRKRYGIVNYYPRIEIASQSKEFLQDMANFLYDLGIKSGQVTPGKRTMRVRIYANNAKNFIDKIGFSHPSKTLHPKPQGVDATV